MAAEQRDLLDRPAQARSRAAGAKVDECDLVDATGDGQMCRIDRASAQPGQPLVQLLRQARDLFGALRYLQPRDPSPPAADTATGTAQADVERPRVGCYLAKRGGDLRNMPLLRRAQEDERQVQPLRRDPADFGVPGTNRLQRGPDALLRLGR